MRNGKRLEKTLLALALAGCTALPLLLAGCGDDSGGKLDLSVRDATAPSPDLTTPADLSPPSGDLGDQD